ncbi:MAG: DUF2971 domain-containing protein [Candidatus Cloacimonetes bacterium]|nr:DUF2971 domain-containing protein [Candidatus Cloacimonadota bacterium]
MSNLASLSKLIEDQLEDQYNFEEKLKNTDLLFHFTKAETAIKFILFEKKLKFNALKNMGDPWENKNFDHYYKNMDRKKSPEIFKKEEEIHKIKSYSKIACFCTNKQPTIVTIEFDPQPNFTKSKLKYVKDNYCRPAYERSRMWNQYAENHKGICVVFSKEVLLKSIMRQLTGQTFYNDYVKYSPQYSYFQKGLELDCNKLISSNSETFVKEYLQNKKDYIFFSKNIDYRDEAEFRLVVYDPKDTFNYLDIQNCIKGVLLGENCHDSIKKWIRDLCKELNIYCGIMEWRNGEPQPWPII